MRLGGPALRSRGGSLPRRTGLSAPGGRALARCHVSTRTRCGMGEEHPGEEGALSTARKSVKRRLRRPRGLGAAGRSACAGASQPPPTAVTRARALQRQVAHVLPRSGDAKSAMTRGVAARRRPDWHPLDNRRASRVDRRTALPGTGLPGGIHVRRPPLVLPGGVALPVYGSASCRGRSGSGATTTPPTSPSARMSISSSRSDCFSAAYSPAAARTCAMLRPQPRDCVQVR